MRNNAAGLELRPLAEVFEEAVETLRQELSEYSFIALVGSVVAGLAVLFCGVIYSSVSLSLIAPVVVLAGVLTLATCTAAYGCVNSHMQPDAGAAAVAMLRRLPSILLPWLPLIIGLWAASYALAAFADYVDRAHIPDAAQILGLIGFAAWYAYPRSLAIVAAFEDEMTTSQAQSLSMFIVRQCGGRMRAIWAIVLAPAALMMGLSLVVEVDTVTGALITCFFVGAMPLAAALMSLLFYDAASQIELAPTPAARPHQADARTGYRRA
jgi:hypothetical protein